MKYEHAKRLAQFAHYGQRYGSKDYFEHHLLGVVQIAERHAQADDLGIDNVRCVAILHDVLEDSSVRSSMLFECFGRDIAQAVVLLTRTSEVSKDEYLQKIKCNRLARIVKIADTLFNLMESSLVGGSEKRIKKYTEQLKILLED